MNVSISRNGVEIGEWTEEQVRAFYKDGQLLPTDHYWREGMTEWAELSRMIKPPPPSAIKSLPQVVKPTMPSTTQIIPVEDDKPAARNAASIPPPFIPNRGGINPPCDEMEEEKKFDWIPESNRTLSNVDKGLKGSGANQLDPLIIEAENVVVSAAMQDHILDFYFGKVGFDKRKNQRLYKESPLGLPGNHDLCQTLVTLNNGVVMTVWFDLSAVSAAEYKLEKHLVENQLVIDRSERIEPIEELEALNKVREYNRQPLLGSIEGQASTIENYGNSNTNPIVVMGLIGLAAYIKSLRILRFNASVTATYKCSLLHSKEIRHTILDEYPVDVFDVSCGATKLLSLLFCIYGSSNDTLYPKGFTRSPFDGDFNFKITDYLKFPQMGYLDGITKNGVVTCAFVKHDKGQLQVLLSKDKLESCPWQELAAHCAIFAKLVDPTLCDTRIMSQKQQDSVAKAPLVMHQSNPSAMTPQRSVLEDGLDLLTARELNVEDEFLVGYQAIANKGKTAVIIFAISLICLGIGWLGALADSSMSKIGWVGLLLYIVGLVYYAKFRRIVRGLHGAVIGVILLIVAPFLIFAYIRMDYRAFKEELERLMLKMEWKGKVEPRF